MHMRMRQKKKVNASRMRTRREYACVVVYITLRKYALLS